MTGTGEVEISAWDRATAWEQGLNLHDPSNLASRKNGSCVWGKGIAARSATIDRDFLFLTTLRFRYHVIMWRLHLSKEAHDEVRIF